MRLHHLCLSAFGPFKGTVEVDFDELSDCGLFLLTGSTGAGKTTILDGVCFALYGTVPGARGVKALKSQHADPSARPEAVLEFSVGDRRYRVRRTPEWSRPKRRGDGYTTENATATLLETSDGCERLLSSRAQEVGHFIGGLVGMQASQFVQVAMLPQGEFQKFLRATSQERHGVLEHLFRTDRYSRIEDWVNEHSKELQDRSAVAQRQVVRVLESLSERTGQRVPEALGDAALEAPQARDLARGWAAAAATAAEAARAESARRHTDARDVVEKARAALEAAVSHNVAARRRDDALAELARLEEQGTADTDAGAALDAHARASRCLPLVRLRDGLAADLGAAAKTWETSAKRLGSLQISFCNLTDPLTVDQLEAAEQAARASAVRLRALLPREERLARLAARVHEVEGELAALEAAEAAHLARMERLPALVATARAQLQELEVLAARADALEAERDHALERQAAADGAVDVSRRLESLRDTERDARDRAADARDLVQGLAARRLAGMAAELAGQLVEGDPCVVCGSCDHPSPARPGSAAVHESEQIAAEHEYQAALAVQARASQAVVGAEERLAGLRAAAGDLTPEDASRRVAQLQQRVEAALTARVAVPTAAAEVAGLEQEHAATAGRLSSLRIDIARCAHSLDSDRQTVQELSREIDQEVGGFSSLTAAVRELDALAEELCRGREVLCTYDALRARLDETEDHLSAEVVRQGFDCVADLQDALLTAEEERTLHAAREARAAAATRAQAVLDEVSEMGSFEGPLHAVEPLEDELRAEESALAQATRALHESEATAEAVGRLRDRLEAAWDCWEPVLAEYLTARGMARLVRGTGADNQLQLRLSAYVLARRLDQVVAAANERLAHMRDERYLLRRTPRPARKGAQAGLGLEVLDQWTGDLRDPATLSGGETFVVSLALALGLADVVSQEAGGTEIETLFVDEGFGSLDSETLDDVMDRLDDLRAGGRAVGVVSHVAELRARIPAQLHVEKGRDGSVVSLRTAVF